MIQGAELPGRLSVSNWALKPDIIASPIQPLQRPLACKCDLLGNSCTGPSDLLGLDAPSPGYCVYTVLDPEVPSRSGTLLREPLRFILVAVTRGRLRYPVRRSQRRWRYHDCYLLIQTAHPNKVSLTRPPFPETLNSSPPVEPTLNL